MARRKQFGIAYDEDWSIPGRDHRSSPPSCKSLNDQQLLGSPTLRIQRDRGGRGWDIRQIGVPNYYAFASRSGVTRSNVRFPPPYTLVLEHARQGYQFALSSWQSMWHHEERMFRWTSVCPQAGLRRHCDCGGLPQGCDQSGDVFHLEEEVCGTDAIEDEAAAPAQGGECKLKRIVADLELSPNFGDGRSGQAAAVLG